MGKKGQRVWTGGGDEAALSKGVFNTYIEDNLRYSQNAALDMYKEVNTGTNLPAQIDLYSVDGDEYKFLCVAKGGGSANKTYLYQETKALLTPGKLKNFLVEKMRTGYCSLPAVSHRIRHWRTSAESTLKTVKLASTHYYDALPTEGNAHGQAFRDLQLEQELLIEAHKLGLALSLAGNTSHMISRDPPASPRRILPGWYGRSCSETVIFKPRLTAKGSGLKNWNITGQYIPESLRQAGEGEVVKVDLNRPMKEILAQLSQYPVSTRLC
jgi:fumarate hydratase class I